MAWGPGEDAARDWFRGDRGRSRVWSSCRTRPRTSGPSSQAAPQGRSTRSARISTRSPTAAPSTARSAWSRASWRSTPPAAPAARRCRWPSAQWSTRRARASAPRSSARARSAGELAVDEVLARTDPDGHVLHDLAAPRGVTAETVRAAPFFLPRVASWIEVHVEQGRRLVDVPAALGVATSLAARERWRCTLRGLSDHAGTAAMRGRRDALVPAARAVLAAHELANAEGDAVATVGRISALAGVDQPGAGRGSPEPGRARSRAGCPGARARRRVRRGRRRGHRGRVGARDRRSGLRLRRRPA